MNKYESVIIMNPNENKEEIKNTIEKFQKIMEDFSNRKVEIEDLGERRLAYEIKHNKIGHYAIFNFYAKPENIEELERNYRIDDNIMKFINVRHEEQVCDEYEESEETL